MKTITSLSLFILCSAFCYSQRIDWVDYAENNLSSTDNAVATDASGNIYSFHTFSGNAIIQGDTIVAPYGQSDCIIVKYDSAGSYLWSKVFGGNWFDDANKIAVDAAGHIYVTAHVQTSTNMSDTVFTNVTDYVVLQFDSSGNFLRVKFIPGLGVTALAALGNYAYIAHSATVEKLDTNLNTVWSRTASSGSFTFYSKGDLYVTPGGRLIASGAEASGNPVVFDTISFNFSAGGFNEVFVISMDTSGNAYWGRALYGTSSQTETTFGAAGDDAGNVYMSLQTSAQLIFGNDTLENTTGNPNNNYTAVLRYDNAGNEVWGRALYPTGSSDFYDVMVNGQAEILLAGDYLNGSAVFEQFNFPASGGATVIKIDMNGNAVWEQHDLINSAFTKHFKGLAQLSPGKYVAVGFFPNNFKLDCFDAGASNLGFFTTVISENPVIDAAFAVSAADPFTFNFTDQSVGAISWSWTFPGGTPATSTSQNPVVTYSTPGSYTATLIVCDGICCDSVSVQILNVGMDEMNPLESISISSNPFTDFLDVFIPGATTGKIRYELSDVTGKIIFSGTAEANQNHYRVQTAGLYSGVYFVTFITRDYRRMFKVVKVK